MTREQRAKQFMPFDAMKGLKEALAVREERRSREEKRELPEDMISEISSVLAKIERGMLVTVNHYHAYHEVISKGAVDRIDKVYQYLIVGTEKIFFDDIYDIKI